MYHNKEAALLIVNALVSSCAANATHDPIYSWLNTEEQSDTFRNALSLVVDKETSRKALFSFIDLEDSIVTSAFDNEFYIKMSKFGRLISGYEKAIKQAHQSTSGYLTSLAPRSFKISITDSPSIFYTLRGINGRFDLKYEVFCTVEGIKCIVFTLYKDGAVILQQAGTVAKIQTLIADHINNGHDTMHQIGIGQDMGEFSTFELSGSSYPHKREIFTV